MYVGGKGVNSGMYLLLHNVVLGMSALGRQRPFRILAAQGPLSGVKRKFALIFHQSKSERRFFPKAAAQNVRKTTI